MRQSLILIRGLPGSGKSTLAKSLSDSYMLNDSNMRSVTIAEADQFFESSLGYLYDAKKIQAAHRWCQMKAEKAMKAGDIVIVSNTFVKLWEMEVYFNMARDLHISVQVIECKNLFGSIHNVPEETIKRMAASWEHYNVTL